MSGFAIVTAVLIIGNVGVRITRRTGSDNGEWFFSMIYFFAFLILPVPFIQAFFPEWACASSEVDYSLLYAIGWLIALCFLIPLTLAGGKRRWEL